MSNRTIAEHDEPRNPNGYHSKLRVERLSSGQPGLIFIIEDYLGDTWIAETSVLVEDGNALLAPVLVWLGQRPVDADLVDDTLNAARALAVAKLDPRDGGHDAANLQQMLAFVLAQFDAKASS